ncbi:aminopeptidase [Candidatus Soleaferrea massiliensis]|uniref:aminopeptidase n=1 Tax=Candidatus Soleaferrea massiliensis TaxID=1470354 RepID=UPI000AE937D0|nr:aminopeptidase [Candidatus Soleaferrea massiliensis]
MSETKKSAAELLQEDLLTSGKNKVLKLSAKDLSEADSFCEGYKAFLNEAKTEREAVTCAIRMLNAGGFEEFDRNKRYEAGDRVYLNNRGKALVIATIGKRSLSEGVHLVAAHIDSPRIDLKPVPLYEDGQLALFKTHYYGGIKKYQWTAMPLSLHGIIVKKDGTQLTVHIGEEENDPVFCISDLLPHLGMEQSKRTLAHGIKGEELNVLVGSRPYPDEKISDPIKLNVMKLLHDKYGIVESDFISADLCLVPAFKARDVGFDRSLIGAYGHDDRVCAYTALQAAIECAKPDFTSVTVLTDKEEVGSDGNTGLQSRYLEYFIADLAKPHQIDGRLVLSNSKCLSADVNAAFDPTFPGVYEKQNSAFVNQGIVITKYTGSGGKGGTSEAAAEFVAYIRDVLDKNGVLWQTGELGKVDEGGGGTVAKFLANLDIDVIDAGVAVISMHAPYEIVAKVDVYNTYAAFKAFLNA